MHETKINSETTTNISMDSTKKNEEYKKSRWWYMKKEQNPFEVRQHDRSRRHSLFVKYNDLNMLEMQQIDFDIPSPASPSENYLCS